MHVPAEGPAAVIVRGLRGSWYQVLGTAGAGSGLPPRLNRDGAAHCAVAAGVAGRRPIAVDGAAQLTSPN